MQVEFTKIIDQYLSNELSPSDRAAFEERLKTNEKLQQEVELHQLIREAAIRASVRADVQQAARRFKLNRIIKWGAAGLGIATLFIVSASWFFSTSNQQKVNTNVPVIGLSLIEKLNPNADFNPLPIQYFAVPKEGDVFLSDQSVLLSVPKNAFLLKGKKYTGEAIVQFQEALQANEIVKAGLNTMTGDHFLETQGMFSIRAYTPSGEKLDINPAIGIYVQVPVNEYQEGMDLYDLVELGDGKTDWQNPRGLSKIPIPVDMNELDFYPVGYEAKLDELKWNQSKRKRDSLYLSFENYCGMQSSVVEEPKQSIVPIDKSESRSILIPAVPAEEIVSFPAVDARFPGGSAAMMKYVNDATVYPESAIEQGIEGRVFVSFVIDKAGFVSGDRVDRGVHPLLDDEALRIVRNMPRWTPAENGNGPVNTRVRLPITFMLDGGGRSRVKANLMVGPMLSKDTKVIVQLSNEQEQRPEQNFTLSSAASVGDIAQDSVELQDTPCNYPKVSPSNVLAFWNPKFNNTNLSTREFEQRMKAIHSTCNNDVLQKYTSQLSKPISEIDREVAKMGYAQFNDFANEQVGILDVKNPHLENLQAFYEKGVSSLQKQAKSDANWEKSLRDGWDNHLAKLRSEHTISTRSQETRSKQEEIAYNQKRTEKKLGLKEEITRNPIPQRTVQRMGIVNSVSANSSTSAPLSPVAALPQFGNTIGFTVISSGGYNCDRSVRNVITAQEAQRRAKMNQDAAEAEALRIERIRVAQTVKFGTEKRETFTITSNGKSRTISYNSLEFEVEGASNYTKVIAYLFPHQLETYQLLEENNGKFTTSLNDDILYDLCIVGISDQGYHYFQKQTFKAGDLGQIKLKRVSEAKLDASLLQMNSKRNPRPTSFATDLSWIKAETKNYREINRRKEMDAFRERVVEVVFPCYHRGESDKRSGANVNPFGV